jgi:hypothetical protein
VLAEIREFTEYKERFFISAFYFQLIRNGVAIARQPTVEIEKDRAETHYRSHGGGREGRIRRRKHCRKLRATIPFEEGTPGLHLKKKEDHHGGKSSSGIYGASET